MEEIHRRSAAATRSRIASGARDGARLREALSSVPPAEWDAWWDLVLGLDELPDDGPELPRDCVPYLPCSVDALLRVVDDAPVLPSDVFVDVGAGIGRAAALVHLVSEAPVIGVEIQPGLVRAARKLASELSLSQMPFVEGDATKLSSFLPIGSIFFLYCPFGGPRLDTWLSGIESIARARPIRVCTLDLPLPPCSWLTPQSIAGDLAIYRSTVTAHL